MQYVKATALIVVIAAIAGLLAVGLVVGLADQYSQHIAPDHEKSPTHYGIKSTSLLMNGIKHDSILCVKKTWGGKYTARAKGYYGRGQLVTVEDSKFDGEKHCNHTTHNLYNHWAGVNPWGGSNKTYWGPGSNHEG